MNIEPLKYMPRSFSYIKSAVSHVSHAEITAIYNEFGSADLCHLFDDVRDENGLRSLTFKRSAIPELRVSPSFTACEITVEFYDQSLDEVVFLEV